jgi:hypothetical protein
MTIAGENEEMAIAGENEVLLEASGGIWMLDVYVLH